MRAACAFLALLALDALIVAYLIRHSRRGPGEQSAPAPWFDEERFRHGRDDDKPAAGVVERVRAARGVLVHPCSYGGDLIEYPVHADFDEDDVLATLAEIEAL